MPYNSHALARLGRSLIEQPPPFVLRQPASDSEYGETGRTGSSTVSTEGRGPETAWDLTPNFDGIWKEALRNWLPQCLLLFWPATYAQINWSVAPVFLDKELQQLGRLARAGGKHVDILVQVQLNSGASAVLLIHLEIQAGQVTSAFSVRMFQYYVRLLERHPGNEILSCAILLDSEGGAGRMEPPGQ